MYSLAVFTKMTRSDCSLPYTFAKTDVSCPHCDGSDIRRHDDGYWCWDCGQAIAHTYLSGHIGGRPIQRYDNSNEVRMVGGYERPWPDEKLGRDGELLHGDPITL